MAGMTTQAQRDKDSFLYGTNMPFIEELYHAFRQNPQSVSADWQEFFQDLGPIHEHFADDRPPKWKTRTDKSIGQSLGSVVQGETPQVTQGMLDSLRALMMIRTFRVSPAS